ncbi:hypothetical protein Poly30_45060 [Planctomycetes bacterium Poly30]|uniref:DUF4331 domain-containing protein n=1 Tax=Saltatorellus ferox TaxID=2528018 RepID=A0A518EXY0_9BACT|nr:hypothetical protein Poly30_45060 [Planctomycetes bacterium Poly30]
MSFFSVPSATGVAGVIGVAAVLGSAATMAPTPSTALPAPSSHREAPGTASNPQVDATDFYMFRSYEAGKDDMVVLVANYYPLQDPYGGPNYFALSNDAIYEIHVDQDGNAEEDLTFRFQFDSQLQPIALNIGNPGQEVSVPIPLINAGAITAGDTSALNRTETYTLDVIQGDRRTGTVFSSLNQADSSPTFKKPVDNIGTKSIADYATYAQAHQYSISLPGGMTGRVFVGQRKDPFVVNLGEVFDLVNFDPTGAVNSQTDDLADKNVTSLVLEVPIAFLTNGSEDVIGAWTTASLRQARVLNPEPNAMKGVAVHGGAFTQVSRLGHPLVNELVIGLPDKDRFNHSDPTGDGQFLTYVTNPSLPELLEILFPVTAPNLFPRTDLVDVFLLGVDTLNRPAGVVGSEMLRLNTATPVTAIGAQNNLGVIGGDLAGYPNGRRPGDDVVDIALRAVMGVLLPVADAPNGQTPFTDGAFVDETAFDTTFPFLRDPIPGAPN